MTGAGNLWGWGQRSMMINSLGKFCESLERQVPWGIAGSSPTVYNRSSFWVTRKWKMTKSWNKKQPTLLGLCRTKGPFPGLWCELVQVIPQFPPILLLQAARCLTFNIVFFFHDFLCPDFASICTYNWNCTEEQLLSKTRWSPIWGSTTRLSSLTLLTVQK